MSTLENYQKKIAAYDLVNKFGYKESNAIPRLTKVTLSFACQTPDIKSLACSMLVLELISENPGKLISSKKSNVLIKVRKGHPIGCVVTLKKTKMHDFLFKFLVEIRHVVKFDSRNIQKMTNFSFVVKNLASFNVLKKHFYLFERVPPLSITLNTSSKKANESFYLLKSLKLF